MGLGRLLEGQQESLEAVSSLLRFFGLGETVLLLEYPVPQKLRARRSYADKRTWGEDSPGTGG